MNDMPSPSDQSDQPATEPQLDPSAWDLTGAFTEEEQAILDLTREVANRFTKLVVQHPEDIGDVYFYLRGIQNVLFARAGARAAKVDYLDVPGKGTWVLQPDGKAIYPFTNEELGEAVALLDLARKLQEETPVADNTPAPNPVVDEEPKFDTQTPEVDPKLPPDPKEPEPLAKEEPDVAE